MHVFLFWEGAGARKMNSVDWQSVSCVRKGGNRWQMILFLKIVAAGFFVDGCCHCGFITRS